jgi:uncharacterized coiled-coil protein SlyX
MLAMEQKPEMLDNRKYDLHLEQIENTIKDLTKQVSGFQTKLDLLFEKLIVGNGKPSIITTIALQETEITAIKEKICEHICEHSKIKETIFNPIRVSVIVSLITAIGGVIAYLAIHYLNQFKG